MQKNTEKSKIATAFAERLNDLIEKRLDIDYKCTIPKQADEIGISYQTFKKYVDGKAECPAGNIVKIARYYNVSTDFLLGVTDISEDADKDIKTINRHTGLSLPAIKRLCAISNTEYKNTMNQTISSLEFYDLVRYTKQYITAYKELEAFRDTLPRDKSKGSMCVVYLQKQKDFDTYDKLCDKASMCLYEAQSVINSIAHSIIRLEENRGKPWSK